MADRPTASTITDQQLDDLYDELELLRVPLPCDTEGCAIPHTPGCPRACTCGATGQVHAPHCASLGSDFDRLESARDVAVQLENENARLEDELASQQRVAEMKWELQRKEIRRLRARNEDLREEHDVHRKALARAIDSTLCRNWDQLIEAAGRLHGAAAAWMADTKTAEARAEGAEQQLATMTAVASGNLRHVQILTATLDAVTALHQRHGGHCGTCADENAEAAVWPCDTAAALDAPAGPAPDGSAPSDWPYRYDDLGDTLTISPCRGNVGITIRDNATGNGAGVLVLAADADAVADRIRAAKQPDPAGEPVCTACGNELRWIDAEPAGWWAVCDRFSWPHFGHDRHSFWPHPRRRASSGPRNGTAASSCVFVCDALPGRARHSNVWWGQLPCRGGAQFTCHKQWAHPTSPHDGHGPAPDDPAERCPGCHTAPCETWCHEDTETPR